MSVPGETDDHSTWPDAVAARAALPVHTPARRGHGGAAASTRLGSRLRPIAGRASTGVFASGAGAVPGALRPTAPTLAPYRARMAPRAPSIPGPDKTIAHGRLKPAIPAPSASTLGQTPEGALVTDTA